MSSMITVGIGQCGCQITKEFIEYGLSNETEDGLKCFFVDTEPKVINKIRQSPNLSKFNKNTHFISGKMGRGSNWSYGYFGHSSERYIHQDFMRSFRTCLERCDNYTGSMIVHSAGGGTGSGLGCRITEDIREEFELNQILNCVVAPSDFTGDSPLQYYNCALTLASLYSETNGIVLLHNDTLSNQLGLGVSSVHKLSQMNTTTSVSMSTNNNSHPVSQIQFSLGDVNHLIANQLSAFLSPCSSIYPWKNTNVQLNIELNEFLRTLCSLDEYKFVQIASTMWDSKKEIDWMKMVNHCIHQLKAGFGGINKTISAVACYRGVKQSDSHLRSISQLQKQLNKHLRFIESGHESCDIWFDQPSNNNSFKSHVKASTLSVAFNSGSILSYLKYLHQQVTLKYNSGAYLHWYYRHGGSKDLFEESFVILENIIDSYSKL